MERTVALFFLLGLAAGTLAAGETTFDKLWDAVLGEDIPFLQEQFAAGLDPETRNPDSLESLFSLAVKAGKEQVVELFLRHGKDPNTARSPEGETPLYTAARLKNEPIIALLLEHGARPLLYAPVEPEGAGPAGEGRDLFLSAIQEVNNRFLELCFASHWDVNSVYQASGVDPLVEAIRADNYRAMQLLIDHGADLTIIDLDHHYRTPLAAAIEMRGEGSAFVQLLKKKNAYAIRYAFRSSYQAEATVDRLRIRKTPGLDGAIVGHLMRGDIVDMIEVSPTVSDIDGMQFPWIRIRSGKTEGWVFGGYLDAHLENKGY